MWPYGSSWQTKPLLLYSNKNFAWKSVTQKVWLFGSSCQTKPSQPYVKRNFAQKSVTQKVWPFESNGQTKPSQLLLIGILLKKVRRRKCDPLGPVDSLNNYISINRNFAQKSETKKVWPFRSSRQSKPYQFCSKKGEAESATLLDQLTD